MCSYKVFFLFKAVETAEYCKRRKYIEITKDNMCAVYSRDSWSVGAKKNLDASHSLSSPR